jgi:hypothetical protein
MAGDTPPSENNDGYEDVDGIRAAGAPESGESIDKLTIFAANEFKIPAYDACILEVWVESTMKN